MYKNFCRSTIHNSQKMEKVQISTKWWMDKKFGIPIQWNITSSIRRKEVLIYATTWINFKDAMWSQRCQRQKTTCYLIPFIWNIQNRQLARDTKHMRVCQILGIEGMESDCFFFLGFIYSWETGRERDTDTGMTEKQAPCQECDMGLDPGSPGSDPGLKVAFNHWATRAAQRVTA